MNKIPVVDMIFVILIFLMIIRGYVKGFVEEIFSWASKVLAVCVAVFLYPAGAAYIRTKYMRDMQYLPEIIAFIAIFLMVLIFLKMLERVLKDVVSGAQLKGVDKVLGLLLGVVEGLSITAIILFVLAVQPVFDASKIVEGSVFAAVLLPLINKVPLDRGKDLLNTALLLLPGIRFTV
jgi:membrane protein required for colicin V production